ncbi:MAG: helix-turn-helix transcriptional regulator [Halanaerobiales bacterium]|nr:helix-turn-helix transcriptional regulator [Halanaerobiales bacterium]
MREELRRCREGRAWSIREAAEKIGITKTRYNQIELGQTDPTPEEAFEICRVVRCTFAAVFPDQVPKYQTDIALRSALVAGLRIKVV